MAKLVIFTDLDGTLLDLSTYSFEKALPALELIKQNATPLILCSSKTRAEIEYYRKKLANSHPFVSENGGGIFIPKNYFDSPLSTASGPIDAEADYDVIRLGSRYTDLRNALEELKQEGFEVRGFGDMTLEELCEITKLNRDEALMAKERDFDEPFIYSGPVDELPHLFESIRQKGFTFTQGSFFHILGNSDKGRALSLLTEYYRKQLDDIRTVAVGDSFNDLPMLEKADYPVIVQKPDGSYDARIVLPHLIKADGIGPEGWNSALMKLMERTINQQ